LKPACKRAPPCAADRLEIGDPRQEDLEIDNYLAKLIVAIDDLGSFVNLIGLCQGGWMAAMATARFPDKVNALVLAGAPIDAGAGRDS
jgi:pimeloyl-ACP methyl ester carboxylesterase